MESAKELIGKNEFEKMLLSIEWFYIKIKSILVIVNYFKKNDIKI